MKRQRAFADWGRCLLWAGLTALVVSEARGQPVRLTTNEWYKAQQLAHTYWLCVVYDPLKDNREIVSVQNPAEKLDHAKRQVVALRYYDIPAEAVEVASRRARDDT